MVAPLILIATVILSYGAALGIATFFFENVFDFPGIDPTLPLFAFIFLVALGIDYNIFLMARVREETLKYGTREGMLRGLAVTGTVITSAGIVLAGHLLGPRRPAAGEPDRDRLHDRDRRPDRHLRGPHPAGARARARDRRPGLVALGPGAGLGAGRR